MTEPPSLAAAAIAWRDGQPFSTQFDDPYFSRVDGRAETEHVFLRHNRLAERWRALPGGAHFRIGETGFGTGLNLLCAAELWLRTARRDARLAFVSAEKYPLDKGQLAQALALWPELAGLAAQLLAVYPPLVPGWHRLWLAGGRIALTLLFEDAATAFGALRYSDHPTFARAGPHFDAWFLDGFSPAKNPDLWTPELFATIADLSAPGATFATFTAAGAVRRGLAGAGFAVAKVAGFGSKRAMLCGAFGGAPELAVATPPRTARGAPTPWYLPRQRGRRAHRQAVVVGGGIAGCTAAAALARRGWQVRLCERHGALAREASGNPQAIIFPRLSVQASPLARINLAAALHASRFYAHFWTGTTATQPRAGERCGVLILPEQAQDAEVFPRLARRYPSELVRLCTGAELTAVAGVALAAPLGLFFPALGWIDPAAVCAELVRHANIRREQVEVADLAWDESTRQWSLSDRNGRTAAEAPVVILANSLGAAQFPATDWLPVKAIRGQVTEVAATAASRRLQTVLCGAGYLAPARAGAHTLGATYGVGDAGTEVRDADHSANLAQLAITDAALPALLAHPQAMRSRGRAALRCVSPDYLPLVGPVPQRDAFRTDYAALRRDARRHIPLAGQYWPGLYVSCAHGSRGMASAPLAAELLASQIDGEALPLARELATALNPARFLIRALQRGR